MELFTPGHLLVLAIVALVLFFGWKQLPDMARSLGRSLRIFKTEIKGMSEDDKARAKADEETKPAEPRALPAAEIVKNDVPRTRPRPTPSPNGQSAAASNETPRVQ
jgi:sec-independent protein translocase protein TatA